MPVIVDGVVEQTDSATILSRGKESARTQWGSTVNTRGTGSIQKVLEAFIATATSQFEQAFDDLYKQRYMRWANGQALDDAAWPLFFRLQPTRAVGTVNITLTSALSVPDPLFAAGSVTFADSDGVRYDLIADIEPNGTTAVTASVRAQELGVVGNAGLEDIIAVSFSSPSIQTDWSNYVSVFTNDEDFAGGRDVETDIEFRRRIRDAPTAREGASVSGLELALQEIAGVTGATVIENTTLVSGTEDNAFHSSGTGTNSETIGGANTKIAVRTPIAKRRFISAFRARFNQVSGTQTFTVRVETHDATNDRPTGTLASANLEKTGFAPADDVLTLGSFASGAYLEAGTYWLVFVQTAGTSNLDGALATAATIANGGFETYTTSPGVPDSWTSLAGTGVVFSKELTIVDAGTNALKIVAGGSLNQGAEQTITGTVADVTYKVTARARTDGVATSQPSLQVYDDTNDEVVAYLDGTIAGTGYESLAVYFTAKSLAVYKIRLLHTEAATSGDIAYFDVVAVSDQGVKYYDGAAWQTSTAIDYANLDAVAGIPAKAFRAYVSGSFDPEDVASVLFNNRSAGIPSDGPESSTVDFEGRTYTELYEEPAQVPVVLRVTVSVTSDFDGDEDTIRNLIVDYIGGTTTEDEAIDGLGVNEDLVRAELFEKFLNDDNVSGVFDVTELVLNRKELVSAGDPANISAGATANLQAAVYEEFTLVDPTLDIDVVLNVL